VPALLIFSLRGRMQAGARICHNFGNEGYPKLSLKK
jgi:hypothetical protein